MFTTVIMIKIKVAIKYKYTSHTISYKHSSIIKDLTLRLILTTSLGSFRTYVVNFLEQPVDVINFLDTIVEQSILSFD